MLPFGGFFLKLIGGEIVKSVFQQVTAGQVPTTVVSTNGVEVGTKHWIRTKTAWGALGVVGYVALNLVTGGGMNVTDINSILDNADNLFLLGASFLTILGRKRI